MLDGTTIRGEAAHGKRPRRAYFFLKFIVELTATDWVNFLKSSFTFKNESPRNSDCLVGLEVMV